MLTTGPFVHYLLLVIGVLGSFFAYTAILRLLAPSPE